MKSNCTALVVHPGRIASLLTAVLGLVLTGALLAQGAPQLVVDLNQTPSGAPIALGAPNGGCAFGGYIYFAAYDPQHGIELWRTDGTAAGTGLFKDINPGSGSSNPRDFVTPFGASRLVFTADDGSSGAEPWRSDGTPAGTFLLKDINPGPDGSDAGGYSGGIGFVPEVYFAADDGTHGREPWRTNGTSAGTVLVQDIRAGSASSMSGSPLTAGVIQAYAIVNDGVHGAEPWQLSPPALITDIHPGSTGSAPEFLPGFGSHRFLVADDGTRGRELWRVVGSNVVLVADIQAGAGSSSPSGPVPSILVGGTEYWVFAANWGVAGRELWRTDGTAAGTTLVKDIATGIGNGSSPEPWGLGVGNPATILFSAAESGSGREVWKTDGTPAGTLLVRNIRPGSASSSPDAALRVGTEYYFRADDGSAGAELWKTDGTTLGTALVKDINPGSATSQVLPLAMGSGGRVLLAATYGPGLSGPWITDGTAAGTTLLRAIGVPVPGSAPLDITDHTGASFVLYAGNDGVLGTELWRSDGTSAGTVLVKDINPGSAGGSPGNLFHWNGKTYFAANDGVNNTELWVTDGTTAGTVMLKDINPGAGFSSPSSFVAFNGQLFFSALDVANGRELWQTDGTAAGTVLVKDINPGGGLAGSSPGEFLVVGTTLYFTASTAVAGAELWKTDGTTAGTVMVEDINPGPAGSAVISATIRGHEKAALGNVLIFAANNVSSQSRLWRSDGTAAGTTPVPGLFLYLPTDVRELVSWNNRVWFATDAFAYFGRELGYTDGTNAFPIEIVPGDEGSSPTGLTIVNNQLLFAATTPAAGRELWKSDGTQAGTVLVEDIYPGPADGVFASASSPVRLFTVPGSTRALFVASDGVAGVELWRTDGTGSGTVLHADINPGGAGSFPGPITAQLNGNQLFFAAHSDATGTELYTMTSMPQFMVFGIGCPGTGGLVPRINGRGEPRLGNAAFALTVGDARPSTTVLGLVGFGYQDLPIGGGCRLHFDILGPFLSLVAATNTRGDATLALPLPNDRSLAGLTAFSQADVFDPQGAFAGVLALTGGLRVVVDN